MRTAIEEDTKQAVSMSSWAEASGVDDKVLKQQLYHGYYCKEELIRSTRSLVLYFAKKYRGMGIALEDLLQVCSNFHYVVFMVRYFLYYCGGTSIWLLLVCSFIVHSCKLYHMNLSFAMNKMV
jgi:hypothetical protein